jgi:thiol-disulfide isomerase/thioredoxin
MPKRTSRQYEFPDAASGGSGSAALVVVCAGAIVALAAAARYGMGRLARLSSQGDANIHDEALRAEVRSAGCVHNLTNDTGGVVNGAKQDGAGDAERERLEAAQVTFTERACRELRLRKERGAKGVVLFWASWCPHCKTLLPAFLSAARRAARRGDYVAMVNVELVHVGEVERALKMAGAGGERRAEVVRSYPFLYDIASDAPITLEAWVA